MTVRVCVKAGDRYGPEYANRLYRATSRAGLAELPFFCLTDDVAGLDPGIRPLPLSPIPEGWWHKLYLFAWHEHLLSERLLYLDLDMVVVGDLTPLGSYRGDFATAAGLGRPGSHVGPERMSSTVMLIPPGFGNHLWWTFRCGPRRFMNGDLSGRGDQWFIDQGLKGQSVKVQDLWPGSVVSYKFHCREAGQPPPEARLVSFHGKPDPGEVEEAWVRRCWTEI